MANELGRGTSIQNSCIDNSGNIYINQILFYFLFINQMSSFKDSEFQDFSVEMA